MYAIDSMQMYAIDSMLVYLFCERLKDINNILKSSISNLLSERHYGTSLHQAMRT